MATAIWYACDPIEDTSLREKSTAVCHFQRSARRLHRISFNTGGSISS